MFQIPQHPGASTTIATDLVHTSLEQAQTFGWVDQTALGVLLVFFVIGLFKGLIWQVSRIAILVVAYLVAGRFGHDVGEWLSGSAAGPAGAAGATANANTGVAGTASALHPLAAETPDTTLYLAYVLIFLGVLIGLSLVAMLLQRLITKAGLGFFDRLGGGLFGVLTGAFVVLFGLFLLNMFAPDGKLAEAAQTSHSLRLSRNAIDWLGAHVDDDLRRVLQLSPMAAPGKSPLTAPEPPPATDSPGEQQPPPTPKPEPGKGNDK